MRRIFSLMMIFPSLLISGEATFSGFGSVSKKPEFVSINITVHSQCYKTAHLARLANDEVVSKIQGQLKRHLTANSQDRVFTSGGWTSPFSTTVYDGEHSYTICPKTFQKMTHIEFTTGNIEGFSEVLSVIQDEILPQFESSADGLEEPITYVVISQPRGDVSEGTRIGMKYQAHQNAVRDARHKLLASINDDGFGTKVEIIGLSDQAPSYSMDRSYPAAVPPMPSGGMVEVSFEDIFETAMVNVRFAFDNIRIVTQD